MYYSWIKNGDEPCVYKKVSGSMIVFLKSSKQDTVVDSTTEAEYIAASSAAKEVVWIKKFISELGVVPSIMDPIGLYYDNNGAIAQAKEPRSHQRSKQYLGVIISFER
ncbi:hypothetical protein KIW84_035958 [Lathyrus oleraceus]|uniref:Gag/pol protein n=1 Tax=Pisum sativum TaxID=3888 RepID=A0A9D5B6S0_PEA|nr:hypothetical protein KIW84_035958 [Pisum sativum]